MAEQDAAKKLTRSPSLKGLRAFETKYPNSVFKNDVYDAYALFLCDRIDVQNCRKADFQQALSYARTQATKDKINDKKHQWRSEQSAKSAQSLGKILGYTVVVVAIVAALASGGQ